MKKIFLIGVTVLVLPFYSCEDEEIVTVEVPKIVEVEVSDDSDDQTDNTNDPTDDLTPDFSFTNEGNVFSLANLTEGASELLWFFGDSSTICNTESPTYDFGSEGGEIDVTLRASNNIGESFTTTQTLTAPEVVDEVATITIDGAFDDWNNIDPLVDESNIAGGSMKILKVLVEGDLINIYLEGNTTMTIPVMDIIINTDEDASTGYTVNDVWTEEVGGEFLYEGPIASNGWGAFYDYIGVDGAWGWLPIDGSASGMISPGVVSIDENTNAVEFSITKSLFGTLGSSFSIGFFENYGANGYLPSTGSLATYIQNNEATPPSIICE